MYVRKPWPCGRKNSKPKNLADARKQDAVFAHRALQKVISKLMEISGPEALQEGKKTSCSLHYTFGGESNLYFYVFVGHLTPNIGRDFFR